MFSPQFRRGIRWRILRWALWQNCLYRNLAIITLGNGNIFCISIAPQSPGDSATSIEFRTRYTFVMDNLYRYYTGHFINYLFTVHTTLTPFDSGEKSKVFTYSVHSSRPWTELGETDYFYNVSRLAPPPSLLLHCRSDRWHASSDGFNFKYFHKNDALSAESCLGTTSKIPCNDMKPTCMTGRRIVRDTQRIRREQHRKTESEIRTASIITRKWGWN